MAAVAQVWKMVRESTLSELISISGGTVAGLLLASMLDFIERVPSLVFLLPGFLALRGSIAGAMSARLGTALHVGTIEPKIGLNPELLENLSASMFLSVVVSVWAGFLSHFICTLLHVQSIGVLKLMLVGLVGGALSSVLLTPFATVAAILVFKFGVDPDNVMGPIITTVGDVVAVLCLLAAYWIVEGWV